MPQLKDAPFFPSLQQKTDNGTVQRSVCAAGYINVTVKPSTAC